MRAKDKKRLSFNETTELINKLDLTPVLNDKVRQVRWLYDNSNKCTMVYDEKLVRLIVQRLQERIKELESSVGNQQPSTESKCNKHIVNGWLLYEFPENLNLYKTDGRWQLRSDNGKEVIIDQNMNESDTEFIERCKACR